MQYHLKRFFFIKIRDSLNQSILLFSQIIIPLVLKSQWETIRFVVGDDTILQRKLLKTIDDLISTDK